MTPSETASWEADDGSLGAVLESDVALDRLAARAPLPDDADPLLGMLVGWAQVVDAEAAAATRTRPGRGGRRADLSAALVSSGVVAVRARRRRVPWWALSSGAAAVITVMAVGLGAQDTSGLLPGASVAESVQSVESTLVAAQMAVESGDAVGARVLLERAQALVAELPEDERAKFDDVLSTAEQGVSSAEEAARQGQPPPAWPGTPGAPPQQPGDGTVPGDVLGDPGTDGQPGQPGVPGGDPELVPGKSPRATPGQGGRDETPGSRPTASGAPGRPGATAGPTTAPTVEPPVPVPAPPAPGATRTPGGGGAPTKTSPGQGGGPPGTPPGQGGEVPGAGRPTGKLPQAPGQPAIPTQGAVPGVDADGVGDALPLVP